MGQEFNQRKNRKGVYWEDRYHATAVETGRHLMQCMVYLDLNMVRAGVGKHPSDWAFSGYNEIQAPRQRYTLIDYEEIMGLFGFRMMSDFAEAYRGWIEESINQERQVREGKWTESIAVGSELFVTATKERLGFKAKGRRVVGEGKSFELRESLEPYKTVFDQGKGDLRQENEHFWEDIV
jgi:putative transposase